MPDRSSRQSLTRRRFINLVGRAGEPFDPVRHDAIAVRDDDDAPDRTVIQVVRSGFAIGDRVLRPAQVVVSRRPESEA